LPVLSDVAKSNEPSNESEYHSSFARTLWLPQPVDGKKASAELTNGILTLRIPKKEQTEAEERIAIN
jgi:HSP20 family molecular chaperone IbpA